MSSIKKMERAADAAYGKYRSATAELLAAQVGTDLDNPSPEIQKLRRRAAAYRAQHDAATRRLEVAAESREDHR